MDITKFLRVGSHFCNFDKKQLWEVINVVEVEEIPDHPLMEEAVFALSQFLIGNYSDPYEYVKGLDQEDRKRVFQTWIDIVQDKQELKHIAKFINEFDQ